MGSQDLPPKPDSVEVEPSHDAAAPRPTAPHAVAKNSRAHKPTRKNAPKSTKRGGKSDAESWVGAVENGIEVVSMVYDGSLAVIGHLVTRAIPENPRKGLPFVAVLGILTFILGNKPEAKHDQLCFGCLGLLALIAVCLVVVAIKNPGTDMRLSEMQDERAAAIKVKPLQY
jgi:hypothetical protein